MHLIIPAFHRDYQIKPLELLTMNAQLFFIYLENLSEQNLIVKVMAVRGTPDSELTPELLKLKQHYKLNKTTEINDDALVLFSKAMIKRGQNGNN